MITFILLTFASLLVAITAATLIYVVFKETKWGVLCLFNRHDWFNADGDPDVEYRTRDACHRCGEPRFTPECRHIKLGGPPCTRNRGHTPPHRAVVLQRMYTLREIERGAVKHREVTW